MLLYSEIIERIALLKKKIEIAEGIISDANKSIETYEAELDELLEQKGQIEDPINDEGPVSAFDEV